MLAFFLAGIVFLVGMLLLARWYAYADVQSLLRVGRIVLLALGAITLIVLAVTGRLGWAMMMAVALAPIVASVRRTARQARNFGRMAGLRGGGTSRVETRFLRMSLDLATGDLDGEVIEGPFAGQRLSAMSRADLLALWAACRTADSQSEQILRAYLDRHHDGWREEAEASAAAEDEVQDPAVSGSMSTEQAYRILGLEPGADEAAIRRAHQRLIAILHPDRGGSSVLAAQVNRARDVLLKASR